MYDSGSNGAAKLYAGGHKHEGGGVWTKGGEQFELILCNPPSVLQEAGTTKLLILRSLGQHARVMNIHNYLCHETQPSKEWPLVAESLDMGRQVQR